jgi:hypothetical protein
MQLLPTESFLSQLAELHDALALHVIEVLPDECAQSWLEVSLVQATTRPKA